MRLDDTYAQSGIHDQWHNVYRANDRQHRFDDAVYDRLFQKLQPRGSWLDAGCGSGTHSIRLARRCQKVLAVDFSPAALERVRAALIASGVSEKVQTVCAALEEPDPSLVADNVHCRGVLMHVPDWRAALRTLCRSVRPGGYVVLFEGNSRSLEALLTRIVRIFQRRRSRMERGDGGLEFWAEDNGRPFLARMADLNALVAEMEANGVRLQFSRPIFLFDLNRFPALLRTPVILLNRLWYASRLPFGSGVMVVGRKTT